MPVETFHRVHNDGKGDEIQITSLASQHSQETKHDGHVHWYRSTLFQVLVIGGVFFCAPGFWNALNKLGAGGLASPWFANATNAAGFVAMAFLCVFGGVIVSKLGVRASLLISSTGDILYAGSLYLNSKNGTQWFLMLGSILSGMTDGLMYAVEGPIITSYPEESRRGKMLSLWVFMRNLAPIIGGAIIFALNSESTNAGGVSLNTYLAIIGIMCAGPFISLFISHPSKVQRKDGVKIILRKVSLLQTLKEWVHIVSSKDLLLLCPFFFTSWLYSPYTGTLQTEYFSVRARALSALIIPFGGVAGGFMIGSFLDFQSLTVAQRARWSFGVLICLNLALWTWTAIVTKQLEDHSPVIDWDHPWFGRTFALFVLFECVTMATQTSLFWIIGHMSDDFIALSYMTGLLRGVECVGQAVAYGIKSSDTSNWISIGFNFGFLLVSIPFSWPVIRKIGLQEFEKLVFHSQPAEDERTDIEKA